MKSLAALVLYCITFTIMLVFFYPIFTTERQEIDPLMGGRDNKASLVLGRQAPAARSSFSSIPIIQGCPRVPKQLMRYIQPNHSVPLTDKEKVLAMCGQTAPLPIRDFFTETMVATLTKLGEGAFADVFGCQKEGWKKLAIKFIPIEGDFKYNDEPQNTYRDIQTETVISLELSLLGDPSLKADRSVAHYTKNFMQLDRVALCQGKFPDFLIDAWDEYDFRKDSDNDRPSVFPEEQLYILYSAENSGVQLGSYVYHSFDEVISILQQVSLTVAIGEAALEFEHRDMHRGNILVRRTHDRVLYFRLDHKEYHIASHGVLASVVDFTLSRINQGDDCVSYTDLNNLPWLFKGKGDIQFDVYRDMRNHSKSEWRGFHPYNNVLWLNYLATKVSIKAKLKDMSSKSWKRKLEPFIKKIKRYSTAKDVFLNVFSPDAVRKINATIKW